jgi:alpha-ketoglutaric semialdehyde dehydrogenase
VIEHLHGSCGKSYGEHSGADTGQSKPKPTRIHGGDNGTVAAVPADVLNLVDGQARPATSGEWLEKLRPADGSALCRVARSSAADVDAAVQAASAAQEEWAERTAVARGELVREMALALRERREDLSAAVVEETGKPEALALGETDAAIEMGLFIAGEGRRSYGRTTTATMAHRTVLSVRQPVGVAGLIISFNTPLPNVAWKVFPAIFCGNGAVLKPSEETPLSAQLFADVCHDVGLPGGVLNIVQGLGAEAGAALVEHPDVDLVSFTGSAPTGRWIAETAGRRLAKVCLELGGKNALVVCDDADLNNAVSWAVQSAFSNAGQRCAAASRIVVFDSVYDEFRDRFVVAAEELSDTGPVVSEASLDRILVAVTRAREAGATVLCGGQRLDRAGWWLEPTVLEGVEPDAEISCTELFGPVTILYRVRDLDEALAVVNDSPYGLTSAIHTASVHRAMRFAEKAQAGVVVVNGGTHGSEPHMGFGGVKQSGTGWREPGVEALDVYSEWKYVNLISDPAKV